MESRADSSNVTNEISWKALSDETLHDAAQRYACK